MFLSSVSIRTTTHVFEHTIPSRDSFRIPKTSVVNAPPAANYRLAVPSSGWMSCLTLADENWQNHRWVMSVCSSLQPARPR